MDLEEVLIIGLIILTAEVALLSAGLAVDWLEQSARPVRGELPPEPTGALL